MRVLTRSTVPTSIRICAAGVRIPAHLLCLVISMTHAIPLLASRRRSAKIATLQFRITCRRVPRLLVVLLLLMQRNLMMHRPRMGRRHGHRHDGHRRGRCRVLTPILVLVVVVSKDRSTACPGSCDCADGVSSMMSLPRLPARLVDKADQNCAEQQ